MLRLISYVLVFIVGFAVCAAIYTNMPRSGGNTNGGSGPSLASASPTSPPPTTSGTSGTSGTENTISAVAKAEPSVVNIDITGKPQPAPTSFGPFGIPFGMPDGQPEEVVPKGQASGVIIKSDGYILTNNHVAGSATSLLVTLHDGRKLKARVVGLDPHSDLAVIKVDATNLPAATIGNSADAQVGQRVIAVGNPLGIGTTATSGIISAIRSPFAIKNNVFPEIIQTDAAINPGNSGGALADLNGDVIGINSAIASNSGGSIGIGFAIPINMAMQHAEQLIQTKSVVYPWIGISYQAQMDMSQQAVQGVLIAKVEPNGPAAKAGLQAGDVLTQINQHPIDQPEMVNFLIWQHKPGESITVSYWRKGQTSKTSVVLGSLPASYANAQPQPEGGPQP